LDRILRNRKRLDQETLFALFAEGFPVDEEKLRRAYLDYFDTFRIPSLRTNTKGEIPQSDHNLRNIESSSLAISEDLANKNKGRRFCEGLSEAGYQEEDDRLQAIEVTQVTFQTGKLPAFPEEPLDKAMRGFGFAELMGALPLGESESGQGFAEALTRSTLPAIIDAINGASIEDFEWARNVQIALASDLAAYAANAGVTDSLAVKRLSEEDRLTLTKRAPLLLPSRPVFEQFASMYGSACGLEEEPS
jgi:hypothetical protein